MWQAVKMDKAGIRLKCYILEAFLFCVPKPKQTIRLT